MSGSGLYLSHATLKRDASTQTLVSLLDPVDDEQSLNAHHRLLWSLFSGSADRSRDFLWRAESDGRFMLLSHRPPNDKHNLFDLGTKEFEPQLSADDRLRFTLRANAVVSRWREHNGKKTRVRHDVVMDRLHAENANSKRPLSPRAERRDEEAQNAGRDWLTRQGERCGFLLESSTTETYRTLRLPRRSACDARFGVLDLQGMLMVCDPELFIESVGCGFGKAKAFGCGLMLIMRA